ncbi:MAG: tannase/feruloyl esterase family alpha/beta hydrolase, partial [Acidobacteriota bacterium]|nr:tannase/feruloyl esterase family alpha/beta hydrolase [Acidobacteriota bacterium]
MEKIKLTRWLTAAALMWTAAVGQEPAKEQSACEVLAQLSRPEMTITMAQPVLAGEFTPAGAPANSPALAAFKGLAAFCRVAATLKPSPDSDIKIEVWMPLSGWNGKFQAVGNGGWSGAISYGPLAAALARGYAGASTDTGHAGGSAKFALGHPEKLIDFGYRSEHEMTVEAKAIIAKFYGNGPKLSYWNGCSSGGKQGLMEAQRFPTDYDGIIAGAPANYWTHLIANGIWVAQAVHQNEASYIPPAKYGLIHKAVLAACDALDGVKDGVIENPANCRFDPKVLACTGEDAPTCLTAPQVEAATKIYAGPKNPRTGKSIFPGMARGSELGWGALAGPHPFPIATDHFKYVVFREPEWDYKTLNFDTGVALADKLDHGLLAATDPNLKAFLAHGGKLLLYHGWNDQLIAPQNTINYYNSVVSKMGASKVRDSVRLFMAPGMNHCAGGDGPSQFKPISVIVDWVENGRAPDQIVVSHVTEGKVDRTRPWCPYPQVA